MLNFHSFVSKFICTHLTESLDLTSSVEIIALLDIRYLSNANSTCANSSSSHPSSISIPYCFRYQCW